jgi:hypothetical protein
MRKYFYLNSKIRNILNFPKSKFKIKILCNDRFEPFIHQQCFKFGIFNNVQFITEGPADLIIVLNKYDKIDEHFEKGVPIYLWLIEPPDYLELYTNGINFSCYDKIFTCKYLSCISISKQIITAPFVHWHHAYNSKSRFLYNGFMPFNYLLNNKPKTKKNEKVFILDSHINNIPGHLFRINMIENINNKKYDLFGSILWEKHKLYKGQLNTFKYNTQEKYKYSLVIENQQDKIYWSEKITDAFLASSFPLYFGSESINSFFPAGSLIRINELVKTGSDIDYLFNNINDIIDLKALDEARNLVLFEYNIFNIFSKMIL